MEADMKRIFIIMTMIVCGCSIYGGGRTLNRIELKGIWWMNSNIIVMRQYLGINSKDKLPVYDFCIEVNDDERTAKIHFVNYPIIYDAKIENIGLNRYNMIYKGKKREFLISLKNDPDTERRYWYFKDTSPKGPAVSGYYDGTHYFDGEEDPRFERTVDGLLKYIEYISSIDSGDNAPLPQK